MIVLLITVLRWLGTLVWSCGGVLLVAWLMGRVFTDQWRWSQYCYWLPSVLALPGSGLCSALGIGLRSLARGVAGVRWVPGRREIGLASGSGLLLLAGVAYTGVVEWRLLSAASLPAPRTLRVLHWNATSNIGNEWSRLIEEQDPDFVVVNPAGYQLCEELVEKYRPFGPPIYRHGFTVLSKFRVVRTAYTPLGISLGAGLDPREGDLFAHRKDPGRALFVELDTTAVLGRPLVVWCLDLPSDISLHRRKVTEEASRALAEYSGGISVLGADGVWSRETQGEMGFPRPDVVVGDLNIPRGSGSLGVLVEGMSPVFEQAGRGVCGTWPYRMPLWHLDQMFIAPWLRGVEYVPLDLGGGTHRAQRADIWLRDP